MCGFNGAVYHKPADPWAEEVGWDQNQGPLLRDVVGFLAGGARSCQSFPRHPSAQRRQQAPGESSFLWSLLRLRLWGEQGACGVPSRFLALLLALPGETGEKTDLPSVRPAWVGLPSCSWKHSGTYLWFCQHSSLPLVASWVRSPCLMNKEYLIACSIENLLIGSKLDYLTCFHFTFIFLKNP